ncbi:hypothetical protein GOODEAATRI_017588, partial [Goodea atripinnis]
LSFYSGHSSFGMYCMLFLSVSAHYVTPCPDVKRLFSENPRNEPKQEVLDKKHGRLQFKNTIVLYVQARMQGKWTRLVRPTIQFFLVTFSFYVGYTRVSDYKHHWSDVLVGLLQGALIAVLTVS